MFLRLDFIYECCILIPVIQCLSVNYIFRPATPIHDLLEHRYQDRWVNERRSLELSKRKKDHSKVDIVSNNNNYCFTVEHLLCDIHGLFLQQKLVPGQVYDTRASILRSYQVPVELAPLWHMPKFANKVIISYSYIFS